MDCGKPISAGAARCQKHANAVHNRTPAMREQARQHLAARQASGINRNDAATAARLKARYADPARRAQLAAAGEIGRANRTPEGSARGYAKQSATKAAMREQRLAWCPAERRGEFAKLSRKLGVAEAMRVILEDIATQKRRRLAAMTPFERQMDALARGATLTTKPVMRKADHAFSLTGSSMG